jgi:hypothetical protein
MEHKNITCPKCQSIDDYKVEDRGLHKTAFCNKCDSYIKNLPQGKPITLFFGKFNGRTIDSMIEPNEIDYLRWLSTKTDLKPNSLRDYIFKHLGVE